MTPPPTAANVRSWSDLDFAGAGLPEGSPDPLQVWVDRAVSYVTWVTARGYDDLVIPAHVLDLLNQAVQMRTEQVVMQSRAEQVETAGDIDLIQSFNAGAYSETRRDVSRRGESRALNPWPALDSILWMLMTLGPGEINDRVSERLDYWRYMLGLQPNAPSWSVVEVDWANQALPRDQISPYEPWSMYF
jgi:hypothetical protein